MAMEEGFKMAGDNRWVTEYFLSQNFTPKSGITPGNNNTDWMNCDEVLARYQVSISGVTSTGKRWPRQNQITGFGITPSTVLLVSATTPAVIYAYDPATNTSTPLSVPGITSFSQDIAHTANKMWIYTYNGSSEVHEWNIQLNPFVATYNRQITNIINSAGLGSIDDTHLISSDGYQSNSGQVYSMNVTNSPSVNTLKFNMTANTRPTGDMMLTSDGKLIVAVDYHSGSPLVLAARYINQYDWNTGALEVQVQVNTLAIYGMFTYNNEIYLVNYNGGIYKINRNSPWTVTYITNVGYYISGASQIPEYCNVSLIP